MKRTWDAKLFFGRCPYTGNFCKVWECDSCKVEAQEREQAQLLDDKEYEEACMPLPEQYAIKEDEL